jgi:hypothetical protein
MNKILKALIILLLAVIVVGCTENTEKPNNILYTSPEFTLTKNGVTQGENEATVVSPTEIRSNYASPANDIYSRKIYFKFSLNEKDNEFPAGSHRVMTINDESESEIFVFGQTSAEVEVTDPGILPVNYPFTFRLDMRPVLSQFTEKGYYEAFDGTRVAKAEFKGVYVAGSSLPLSWDFVGLEEKGLQLTDPDGDGIYTLTLQLNPKIENESKSWTLTSDISALPSLRTEVPIVDALYNLALQEATLAVEPDSTFRTGAKWEGVWTRDISYSIYLAMATINPESAKISLMKKVRNERIIQDTGSGGSWPVSSDRAVWALAAWEVYLVTGDREWLQQAYTIIKNSADDDYMNLYSPATGMYKGESSFLDWREQTYPKWMQNMDIYTSENLGTNAVHYQAHSILVQMARLLGEPYGKYEERAAGIKLGMNEHLWLDDKGYYAQYFYGRHKLQVSPRFEALGEALAVIFDIAPAHRAEKLISSAPLTPFGTPCIYPQIPGIPPYHNDAVWPFVQAYWNLAAAKTGNEKVLNHGLASIYRAAALFLSNYENLDASTGDFKATEINSHQMLWSIAGNIAMVHRVFFGMQFEPDKLTFSPVVPEVYGGNMQLSNFRYRDAILDISVKGFGNEISKVLIDGAQVELAEIPANFSGAHRVQIYLADKPFAEAAANFTKNNFSLPNPLAKWSNDTIHWQCIEGATAYYIFRNGVKFAQVSNCAFAVAASDNPFTYTVAAIDSNGYQSFISETVMIGGKITTIEIEDHAEKSTAVYVNFSGKGFVELSTSHNTTVEIPIKLEPGTYLVDIRYSNGSGHINTDNKCGLRSLYLNGEYKGPVVMPQRGLDEWSDWGYSNSHTLVLSGKNDTIKIVLEPWNTNMNIEVNRAMIDHVRLIRISEQ